MFTKSCLCGKIYLITIQMDRKIPIIGGLVLAAGLGAGLIEADSKPKESRGPAIVSTAPSPETQTVAKDTARKAAKALNTASEPEDSSQKDEERETFYANQRLMDKVLNDLKKEGWATGLYAVENGEKFSATKRLYEEETTEWVSNGYGCDGDCIELKYRAGLGDDQVKEGHFLMLGSMQVDTASNTAAIRLATRNAETSNGGKDTEDEDFYATGIAIDQVPSFLAKIQPLMEEYRIGGRGIEDQQGCAKFLAEKKEEIEGIIREFGETH